jgi:hypothetical protein
MKELKPFDEEFARLYDVFVYGRNEVEANEEEAGFLAWAFGLSKRGIHPVSSPETQGDGRPTQHDTHPAAGEEDGSDFGGRHARGRARHSRAIGAAGDRMTGGAAGACPGRTEDAANVVAGYPEANF